MKNVTVLGATGSIGLNTLDVIQRNQAAFKVFAVSGHSQLQKLLEITLSFSPKYVVVTTSEKANQLADLFSQANIKETQILFGEQALCDISSDSDVDIVMSAIVGAAGLVPTMAAIKAGKQVLLANKESLVMSGELFIQAVEQHQATLIPVDSEHNAIFQCLPKDYQYGNPQSSGISHLLLTASGGPFRELPLNELHKVTPDQACNHPNWDMGRKISVDSASMMNKGLEFIEAKWLFGIAEDNIKVVIHPQSTIHSMVQYVDGSVLAQMGNPDMRTPIAHALAFPERIVSGVKALDFFSLQDFSFQAPCESRFPNLYLAMHACKLGQSATTALNAGNEVAVDAFLNERIGFMDIYNVNDKVVNKFDSVALASIEDIIAHDKECRNYANDLVRKLSL
ncbi:1-deoxy-D-xylulose-5-phosphate reductoisomerase [Glaciecola sp. 1036]|uniref:1-deoxy-D-xylulose-5-phosphate reductoisomerase n=1 Tax=Alteromonadaceae TaxID=72275 RepID=UPI003CFDB063